MNKSNDQLIKIYNLVLIFPFQSTHFVAVILSVKNSYYKDVKFIKKFGANLQRLRKGKGISQEEMANELGFSQPHIANIESGTVNTSISHAAAFARALKISVSTLFEFN